MPRKLIFTLTFVLVMAIAATAWAGSFSDAQYQGRIETDHGTFFGFDLDKKDGVTKLTHVETLVKLQCTDGEQGQFAAGFKGSLRVKKNDSFKGSLTGKFVTRGVAPGAIRATVRGKLQGGGKARGSVDEAFDFASTQMRGGQNVHCYTGDVSWAAKRGATVNPEEQDTNPRPIG